MIDYEILQEVAAIGEQRRAERRRFLKLAGASVAAAGGLSALSACDDGTAPVSVPSPTSTGTVATITANDVAVLNFALNLEYLEASYYNYAALGTGLNSTLQTGTGTQGAVTGGRQVSFADATIASYAREIASDEYSHVLFLRTQLGSSAVAQPAINIDGTSATGAFSKAAVAAGVATAAGTFDPYASDDNFLIGGMLLSDVGVTAYKGAATLINSKVILEAAAGILAVEAYHSGLIRTLLYRRGLTNNDRNISAAVAAARDSLDGNVTSAGPPATFANDDNGVGPVTINGGLASTIVPADANAIVFGRPAAKVLNIVYETKAAVTSGGFFPAGLNGSINASTQS